TRFSIVSVDETRERALARGNAYDDLAVNGQRRVVDGQALAIVGDHDIPDDAASFCVQRDEMCVECGHVEPVSENREAAVSHHSALAVDIGEMARVSPNRTACAGVE